MDSAFNVIEDIATWLLTSPSREAILTYVKNLPENHYDLVWESRKKAGVKLYREKKKYFDTNNLSDFELKVSEYEQILFIQYLTQYNPSSVLVQLKQEHPSLTIQAFPSDIESWCKDFLQKRDAILLFATAPEFIQQQVYANTFLNSDFSQEEVENIRQEFVSNYLNLENPFDISQPEFNSEIGNQRKAIEQLGFLNGEYVNKLLNANNSEEKELFFLRITCVLTVLASYGIEEARTNPQHFFEVLWDSLKTRQAETLCIEFEGQRLANDGLNPQYTEIFRFLREKWSLSNIRSGITESSMRRYLATLSPNQKESFNECFAIFLENSITIQSIFYPLDPQIIIPQAESIKNKAEATMYTEQIVSELPSTESQETAKIVLNLLLSL